MRRLTPADFRFLIRYALSTLPKSLLQDIQRNRPKRDVALDLAADQICEHNVTVLSSTRVRELYFRYNHTGPSCHSDGETLQILFSSHRSVEVPMRTRLLATLALSSVATAMISLVGPAVAQAPPKAEMPPPPSKSGWRRPRYPPASAT